MEGAPADLHHYHRSLIATGGRLEMQLLGSYLVGDDLESTTCIR